MIKKIENSSRILKRLAGKKWGGTTEILNETYKSYVKPVLRYGGECDSTLHKIKCSDL